MYGDDERPPRREDARNNRICIHGSDTRLEDAWPGSLDDSPLGRTNLLQLPRLPEKEQPDDHGARLLGHVLRRRPRGSPDSCVSGNRSRITEAGEAADSGRAERKADILRRSLVRWSTISVPEKMPRHV